MKIMGVERNEDLMPPVNCGERHVAVIILVDISGSMSGKPIEELNQGLIEFRKALEEDSLAMGRADVSIISFNSNVQTEMGFRPAAEYEAPHLTASGGTSLNGGIITGLDAVESRKGEYRAEGVDYYRPWVFLLTDGAPTDSDLESEAKSRLRSAIENKKVVFMPMGIGANADIRKLQSYYPENAKTKPVLKADANNFKEAFVWLSKSIGVVSHSDPTVSDQVNLPPTPSIITVGL